LQGLQGFLHAATAFTAQGLQGLQASSTPAMHSSIFFAAHGLQGLHAARAMLVLPTAAIDIVTARAIGFNFVGVMLNIPKMY